MISFLFGFVVSYVVGVFYFLGVTMFYAQRSNCPLLSDEIWFTIKRTAIWPVSLHKFMKQEFPRG